MDDLAVLCFTRKEKRFRSGVRSHVLFRDYTQVPWNDSLAGNSWVDTLTPSTSECDSVWRQGPCWGNSVKMRPPGWALIQCDCCPLKQREIWRKLWTGRWGRDTGKPGCLQDRERGLHRSRPRGGRKEPTLLTSWFQTSTLQNWEKVNSCRWNPSGHAAFSWQPLQTNTRPEPSLSPNGNFLPATMNVWSLSWEPIHMKDRERSSLEVKGYGEITQL